MRRLIAATMALTLLIALGQAMAAGGLASSPAIVEHLAIKGAVGTLSLSNTTSGALKVTVTPRPWIQSHSGVVTPDRRHNLKKYVRAATASFTMPANSKRSVALSLLKIPGAKSLYGAIDVVGLPTVKRHNGITAGYRLIGSLRLNPVASKRRVGLTIGKAILSGPAKRRTLSIAVRNKGNTVDPITGDLTVTGPSGARNADVAGKRIVPGAIVYVPVASLKGLPSGAYTVSVKLKQGGKQVASATRSFRL